MKEFYFDVNCLEGVMFPICLTDKMRDLLTADSSNEHRLLIVLKLKDFPAAPIVIYLLTPHNISLMRGLVIGRRARSTLSSLCVSRLIRHQKVEVTVDDSGTIDLSCTVIAEKTSEIGKRSLLKVAWFRLDNISARVDFLERIVLLPVIRDGLVA